MGVDVFIFDLFVCNLYLMGGVVDFFNICGFFINEGNSGEFVFEGVYGIVLFYWIFIDYIECIEVFKGFLVVFLGMLFNGGVGGVINVVLKCVQDDLICLIVSYGLVVCFGGYWDVVWCYGDGK